MICYLDRTFCCGDGCRDKGNCPRWANAMIRDAANKAGMPISLFSDHTALE
jgi:hypothetical protein